MTDVLKTTGDERPAADAVQDTVETILSVYAAFFTEDRINRVNQNRRARREERDASRRGGGVAGQAATPP